MLFDVYHQQIMEGAQQRLSEFRDEYFKDTSDVRWEVRGGDIAEEILRYIREEGIDLLIMGTHGRKGLDRIVFGSVAERLVKTSPVPVMLVNPYQM